MLHNFGDFTGPAKRIDDLDIPRIGHIIGVGEDEVHAVLDVESAGKGFDNKNRPKMLFEPHIFYRELKRISPADLNTAVNQGLAYAKWIPGRYPSDSYPRLTRAMKLSVPAALRSASWGLGQIMGFNHTLAGYNTVEAMVREMIADEENHLEAMIMFIKNSHLDDELRAHNWSGFARGYNGAGYAKHGYHTRLANAFAKWQRIKDTPWSPEMVEAEWEVDDTPVYDDTSIPKHALEPPDGRGQIENRQKSPASGFWGTVARIFKTLFWR